MISNALFDLDGTLTDPRDGITRCIQFSLGRLGREAPQANELVWCIGPPLRASFSRLLHTSENTLLNAALQHYRERFSEIGIYENVVYPGIISTLQRIRATGFRVFLATSKPTVYASRILSHFYDDFATEFYDDTHSEWEDRFLLLGPSSHLRLVMVCHRYRESEPAIRIISARKPTSDEARFYRR